jgi:hypothetical protein
MWGEFNIGDSRLKSRPPTTIKIEIDLIKQRITVAWEILMTTREVPFPADEDSANDVSNVLWVAHTAIEVLEQCNPPERFVNGDIIHIWQTTAKGKTPVASVEVSVAPSICPDCHSKQELPN